MSPPEASLWLVETLIHVARSDQHMAEAELAFIERAIAICDAEARVAARSRLESSEPPPLSPPPATLSYGERLAAFRDVVALVFVDQRMDRREQALLMRLAAAMSLRLADVQATWSAAR